MKIGGMLRMKYSKGESKRHREPQEDHPLQDKETKYGHHTAGPFIYYLGAECKSGHMRAWFMLLSTIYFSLP